MSDIGEIEFGSQKISVQTDMSVYIPGDMASIFGNVSKDVLREGEEVVIQVFDPTDTLARMDIANVTSDGYFEYEYIIGGPLMPIPGEYKVVATYRGIYQAETSFQHDPGDVDYSCGVFGPCTYDLMIGNITYTIYYRINGYIENVTADVDKKTLIIEGVVLDRSSGVLFYLQRNLIEAKQFDEGGGSMDGRFIVLVEGKEVEYEELVDYAPNIPDPGSYRYLGIKGLVKGSNQIEIVGTWLAPEFGALAIVTLAGTVAGLIVWARSTVRRKDFA